MIVSIPNEMLDMDSLEYVSFAGCPVAKKCSALTELSGYALIHKTLKDFYEGKTTPSLLGGEKSGGNSEKV